MKSDIQTQILSSWCATSTTIAQDIFPALRAKLHERMPDCIRLRPVGEARPLRFEVAENLNLQALREAGTEKWQSL